MATPFADIVRSRLFTFHVGTGEKKDTIQTYSEAVAATSEKMRALIEGDMEEAATGRATLSHVETEDFLRFYEYALRGDYTVPEPGIDEEAAVKPEVSWSTQAGISPAQVQEDIPVEEAVYTAEEVAPAAEPLPEVLDEWNTFGVTTKKKKKKKSPETTAKLQLRKNFDRRDYLSLNPERGIHDEVLMGFQPKANDNVHQDFTPTLLAHARLYTFASSDLIPALQYLALHKLHQTLRNFQLYHARIGDIIALARYAYENNHNRKENGMVDRLRELVVEYIACEIDVIGASGEWEELIEEGGEFVVDFWRVARGMRIVG